MNASHGSPPLHFQDAAPVVSTAGEITGQQQRLPSHNATTITSTVTIRVTPRDDYLVSWSFLWAGFFAASVVAAWQVVRENRILRAREAAADAEHGGTEAVSTADLTRCTFRRLLLLAMVVRLITILMMIQSEPMWLDFVGDTLPEMIFATAWTLMVTFFVQLVGSATGTVTNTDASIVIQGTAYIVYTCLIILELYNSVASVLLYALLCCIYAALLGALAYFCPKLWTMLRPSLTLHRALVIRLYVCTMVCLLVFLGHMVNFARIVIAPPRKVYWWINYGTLELVPAIVFLAIMNPTSNSGRSGRNSPDLPSGSGGTGAGAAAPDEPQHRNNKTPPGGHGSIKRVDSVGSAASSSQQQNNRQHKRSASAAVSSSGESVSLMKPSPSYGSTIDNN